ncbi:hypothetical protein [Burkholderia sp. TSV86]|uniref:hypothetical protein n=1 Tax=Burkholderia sp. TSV86 TaxID=1385594 RepID=UPI000756FF80|nr:hypothetical protein [Burkholderia sp. TSV86]KVE31076.1 hypothetical protein WS68_17505 [Burkholderia sp. TSV86]
MPDIQNPYNVATEDTAGRLRALGVLTPYDPPPVAAYGLSDQSAPVQTPAPAGSQQVGPAAPSWDAYKSANGYDGTDFVNRQQLWDTYRNNVIPDIAAAHGEDANTLRSFFDQQYGADKPKAPTRSMLRAPADWLGAAAGSAAGAAKSVVDLFAPGSTASNWLAAEQKYYADNASPVVKDSEQRVAREIAEDEAMGGSGVMPTVRGMVRSPVQTAAKFAGGLAPAVAAGLIPGAGEVAVPAMLAAQGGGQVRGALYDKLQAMPDATLMSSSPAYAQLRQSGMSEGDAKSELASLAKNWPEIGSAALLGAVTARIAPVERGLAGLTTGLQRPAAAALEAATNAAQSAGTQLATNAAVRGVLPDQPLSEGVAREGVTGALAGGLLGGAFGGRRAPHPEAAPADVATQDASAPVLALPAPTYRLNGPDEPPAAQGFTIEGSAYNAVPDDVAAALGTLPKVYNRQWATDYLTSALRNGTLEDAARQQNSIGRAAQALLARVQERAKPRQLDAPEMPAVLPSPDMPDASGDTLVDSSGGVRQPTYQESADARAARQSALDTGLSTDVRAAQEARLRSADAAASEDAALPAADPTSPSTELGASSEPSIAAPETTTGVDRVDTGATESSPAPEAAADRADASQSDAGTTIEGSPYTATADDVKAVIDTLPKIYNRQAASDYLTSALRSGTLEAAAQQPTALGRAARALVDRLEAQPTAPTSASSDTARATATARAPADESAVAATPAPVAHEAATAREGRDAQPANRPAEQDFRQTYGDDDLAVQYARTTDPRARVVLDGMAHASNAMARLDGAGDLDIRPFVTQAARRVVMPESGTPDSLATRVFARLFSGGASDRQIGEALRRIADFAYEQSKGGSNDAGRSKDMGVAVGREPAESSALQQAADAGRRAHDRSAEEVGSGRADDTARTEGEAPEGVAQTSARHGAAEGRPPEEPPPHESDLSRNEAPPREGLRTSGRMTGDDVRRAIADDMLNHNVDVYDTINDAPDYVREQARREGAADVEGFFDPKTNRVALIAENIASPERARSRVTS